MPPPWKLEFLRRSAIYKITRRHEPEAVVTISQLAGSYHQSQRKRSYLFQLFRTAIRCTPSVDIRDTPNKKCSRQPVNKPTQHEAPPPHPCRTVSTNVTELFVCLPPSVNPSCRPAGRYVTHSQHAMRKGSRTRCNVYSIRSPDRPTRSQSLYRRRYPAHTLIELPQ